MKKNRIIAIICCASVLLSGLTACGKSSDNENKSNDDVKSSASESQTE